LNQAEKLMPRFQTRTNFEEGRHRKLPDGTPAQEAQHPEIGQLIRAMTATADGRGRGEHQRVTRDSVLIDRVRRSDHIIIVWGNARPRPGKTPQR